MKKKTIIFIIIFSTILFCIDVFIIFSHSRNVITDEYLDNKKINDNFIKKFKQNQNLSKEEKYLFSRFNQKYKCSKDSKNYLVCIIKNIINDFKKQKNYLILKHGIIKMKATYCLWCKEPYSITFTNIAFKKNNTIFDEYITNKGKPKKIFYDIKIHKRNILINETINEFKYNDQNKNNDVWLKNGNYSVKDFEKKTFHIPGDFFLYNLDKNIIDDKTTGYNQNGKMLTLFLILQDNVDDIAEKYKNYIEFVSQNDDGKINTVAKDTKFKSIFLKFKIDLENFQIKEIYILDKFETGKKLFHANVENKIHMTFFYNELVDLDINDNANKSLNYMKYPEINNFNEKDFDNEFLK